MIALAKVTALLAVDYSSANHNKKEDEPLLSSGEFLHVLDHSDTTTVRQSGTGQATPLQEKLLEGIRTCVKT